MHIIFRFLLFIFLLNFTSSAIASNSSWDRDGVRNGTRVYVNKITEAAPNRNNVANTITTSGIQWGSYHAPSGFNIFSARMDDDQKHLIPIEIKRAIGAQNDDFEFVISFHKKVGANNDHAGVHRPRHHFWIHQKEPPPQHEHYPAQSNSLISDTLTRVFLHQNTGIEEISLNNPDDMTVNSHDDRYSNDSMHVTLPNPTDPNSGNVIWTTVLAGEAQHNYTTPATRINAKPLGAKIINLQILLPTDPIRTHLPSITSTLENNNINSLNGIIGNRARYDPVTQGLIDILQNIRDGRHFSVTSNIENQINNQLNAIRTNLSTPDNLDNHALSALRQQIQTIKTTYRWLYKDWIQNLPNKPAIVEKLLTIEADLQRLSPRRPQGPSRRSPQGGNQNQPTSSLSGRARAQASIQTLLKKAKGKKKKSLILKRKKARTLKLIKKIQKKLKELKKKSRQLGKKGKSKAAAKKRLDRRIKKLQERIKYNRILARELRKSMKKLR